MPKELSRYLSSLPFYTIAKRSKQASHIDKEATHELKTCYYTRATLDELSLNIQFVFNHKSLFTNWAGGKNKRTPS
jgi:hypothetical protein